MHVSLSLAHLDMKHESIELNFYFCLRYQFVPQMIFLNSLFGYLSLLIVVKWCTGSQADLYHVMIYMFLSPTDDLGENQLFWGQRPLQVLFCTILMRMVYSCVPYFHQLCEILQILLLLLALIAVPWMLFPKPFILKRLHIEVNYLLNVYFFPFFSQLLS